MLVIDWTAVGVCLTAIIAVWQLRENGKQKAADRELETKRGIMFDGVRGMARALQAFSSVSNLKMPFWDSVTVFQEAMASITVASSVAQVQTAKAGKEFTDALGPKFVAATAMRLELESLHGGVSHPDFWTKHNRLAEFILENSIELTKAMLRAIAAVRADVGIAKEHESQFLKAVYPDEALIKSAVAKARGVSV